MLNSFDVVLLARLCLQGGKPWRYADLAHELRVSESQCHRGFNRLIRAGLSRSGESNAAGLRRVAFAAAEEFLLYGVKYCFAPERGPVVRGMATGVAGPPLAARFQLDSEIPVWPDALGESRGVSLKPFYKGQVAAARADRGLYEMLCLLDAIRAGRARERNAAEKELRQRLKEMERLQHEQGKEPRPAHVRRTGA